MHGEEHNEAMSSRSIRNSSQGHPWELTSRLKSQAATGPAWRSVGQIRVIEINRLKQEFIADDRDNIDTFLRSPHSPWI